MHSFDLVAANERVVACDMSNVPLDSASVDVAIFCLSLVERKKKKRDGQEREMEGKEEEGKEEEGKEEEGKEGGTGEQLKRCFAPPCF